MSYDERKPVFGVFRSDTNRYVQSEKRLEVTAQLICIFVFAYTKMQFSRIRLMYSLVSQPQKYLKPPNFDRFSYIVTICKHIPK